MAKVNLKFLTKLSKKGKIVLIAILAVVIATGSILAYFLTRPVNDSISQYSKIYKNYQSLQGFKQAEKILHLKDGIRVDRYDAESGLFILKKTIVTTEAEDEDDEDETMDFYGFANREKMLVNPAEHLYVGVLGVKQNYALMVKTTLQDDEYAYKVGLIRFDANGVHEYGFAHDYKEYLITASFQGDYLAYFAGQGYVNPDTATYTVFYDYKSTASLREAFRVKSSPTTVFFLYENWLVASDLNKTYFYDIHKIDPNGYLVLQDTYFPFEDETRYPEVNVSFSINYLGNNWFVRKAIYLQNEPFQGYLYTMSGEKPTDVLYVAQKNDRYNTVSKKSLKSDILLVDKVANKYSNDIFEPLAIAQNLFDFSQMVGGSPHNIYSDPVFAPSKFINDGYTIVYNYFFPEPTDRPETSFLILDPNANIIKQEQLYLPPLFVDGIGIENPSINYPNLIGNAQAHYLDGSKKILKEYAEGQYTYEATFAHNNMLTVYQYKIIGTTVSPRAGAIDLVRRVQSVPFVYDTLSMFVDGWAIGSILEDGNRLQYYRISKDGDREPISGIDSVKHGVYIGTSMTRKALYAYDGTELIPNHCSDIIVYELFLSGSQLLESIVVTEQGEDCVVYILS